MPKFTMSLAATAAVALAAIFTVGAASAQTYAPYGPYGPYGGYAPYGAGMVHSGGSPAKVGQMCWVNTDPYREIDTHGYWQLCEPAASANASVPRRAAQQPVRR